MKIIKKIVEYIFSKFGLGISVWRLHDIPIKDEVKINVGSGDWEKPGWINLDYPSEHYHKMQSHHKIIPYDIRHNELPFENNSVGAIYSSHVIEHVENEYVSKLFDECYRVLKVGGVLRITCPDASFLYDVTQENPEYWWWRKEFFGDTADIKPVDYLLSEIGTGNVTGIGYIQYHNDYHEKFETLSKDEFLSYATEGLNYDIQHVASHINNWTYEKLSEYLKKAGFKVIIRSKYMGSCYPEMQDQRYFDLTERRMSLYVEAVKT